MLLNQNMSNSMTINSSIRTHISIKSAGGGGMAHHPSHSWSFLCSQCAPCRSFDLTQSPVSLLCALLLFSKGSDAYEHTASVTGTFNTPDTHTYVHTYTQHVSKGSIHTHVLQSTYAHIYIQRGYIRIGVMFCFVFFVCGRGEMNVALSLGG